MVLSWFKRRKSLNLESSSLREILAIAILAEEEDGRIYRTLAQDVRDDYPETAKLLTHMAHEEDGHRKSLIALYQSRFGETIPLIRREDMPGGQIRKPFWLMKGLSAARLRDEVEKMERNAQDYYLTAARLTSDSDARKLLGDLAAAESEHEASARLFTEQALGEKALKSEEDEEHRQFILTWVQPGLAGLMDGSVSTLAPIFATAFATQDNWTTLLVGLAASLGAGISMGFTEAASDDGVISGRGSPFKRGMAAGVMTAVGGLAHAMPYLLPDFWMATIVAVIFVFCELWAIAWIQNRYMDTPFWRAVLQVVLGGGLVFAVGILIGNA